MIPIRNIYWMLAYAFRVLDRGAYKRLGSEEFDNSLDLCAAVLVRGLEIQVKRGLGRGYVSRAERLSCLCGKVDIAASIKSNTLLKRQLVCEYDDFSIDVPANRIIKETMRVLLRSKDVSPSRKKGLRRLMPLLEGVSEVDLRHCDFGLPINRNNQGYRLLLFVCRLVRDGMLMTEDGTCKAAELIDDQATCRLYEHFILEYYRREHPELIVSSAQIPWALDLDEADMLPVMQTDVMLRRGSKTLIIDAKYYSHMMQESYGVRTQHSGNLYQLFAYVKNMQEALPGGAPAVQGMLMYARTDEAELPDSDYSMSGNPIKVRSLDLSCDFEQVRAQLEAVVDAVF